MNPGDRLRQRLRPGAALPVPGCYDALTALLVQQAGFEAAYVSGASIAYTRLGRPDIGLVTATEVAEVLRLIRERIELPLIVDADTGHGNALNVQRTVRSLELAGADCVQLEDQVVPKRCGHLGGKSLVPVGDMISRLRAALDARHHALVMARTDAIGVEGFEAALERAERYLAEGVDLLFIEAPRSVAELVTIGQRFGARVPLLANMVEGGQTPSCTPAELGAYGFQVVIHPGAIVRALTFAVQRMLDRLRQDGTTLGERERMLTVGDLNELLDTRALLEAGRRFEPEPAE
ncbi:MAG: isocitrate lyase/PEP mutase family protein [Sinobacteraceae bacterium]|nr:isocitrate lyase/PEP mutase family protein [Pseudomonadales bacterium]MCP5359430.1 isocitrate lyase/PEP mutase family protein [Nevskiaceae bacterium]